MLPRLNANLEKEGGRGVISVAVAPSSGRPLSAADKEDFPCHGASYRTNGSVAHGELLRERCFLDTGLPPGVVSQEPGNRGSARVEPNNRGTRGTRMEDENTSNKYEFLCYKIGN